MKLNANILEPVQPTAAPQSTPAPASQAAPAGVLFLATQAMLFLTSVLGSHPCPDKVATAPLDADGYPIPTQWQPGHDARGENCGWCKQPKSIREKWAKIWIEEVIAREQLERMNAERNQKKKGPKALATKFTTQAAVDWGKRQKKASGISWSVIDRERWGGFVKGRAVSHSHDLMLGLDVLFDTGAPGMYGVQAGTPGQEKEHAQTFLDRGGYDKAARRSVSVWWLAFVRGNPEPVEGPTEWTEDYLRRRFPDLFAGVKI